MCCTGVLVAGEAANTNPYWPWIEVSHVQDLVGALKASTAESKALRALLSNETTNRGVIQVVERLDNTVSRLEETCSKLILSLDTFSALMRSV